MNEAQIRGFGVFTGQGRCVSCHTIEQTQALFTGNRFHNTDIGSRQIQGKENATAAGFAKSGKAGANVDVTVLTKENMPEFGRFAVIENPTEVGALKTSPFRNIAVAQPYMHDGSLKTLEGVADFYNNGGREKDTDPLSGFLSGGIQPMGLSYRQKADLVEFMEALTSPEYESLARN